MLIIFKNLTIKFLTLVDFHLQTFMHCYKYYLQLIYNISIKIKLTFSGLMFQWNIYIFCRSSWKNTMLFPGYYVLWSLCDHLQTPTLCHHHINNRICWSLVLYYWIPALVAGLQLLVVLTLGVCVSTITDHFVFDVSSILNSSFSDTWLVGPMVIVCAVLTLIIILLFSVSTVRTIKKCCGPRKGSIFIKWLWSLLEVVYFSVSNLQHNAINIIASFSLYRHYPHWCLV